MPRDWLTIFYLYARPQVWEVYSVSSLFPLRLNVLHMGWGACLGGGAQGTLELLCGCTAEGGALHGLPSTQSLEKPSLDIHSLTSQGSQQLSRQSESAGPALI